MARDKAPWWQGNAAEKYWLEATDRVDIGTNLKAPVSDASGQSNWRYDLFKQAAIDDIVYHYDVRQGAIASWSQIAGPPEARPIVWVARGSYARERRDTAVEVPGYIVPLTAHTALRESLTLNQLRQSKTQIADMLQTLSSDGNNPLYFPFETSDRPLRLLQGYAFKLPEVFVNAFPQLSRPSPPRTPLQEIDWTDAEIATCIEAYTDLLGEQTAGRPVEGSAATRTLVEQLGRRSEGAVIRRLQSISTVLQQQGLQTLSRFPAREQVGTGVEARIANLLEEMQPTANPEELERRTRRTRARLRESPAQAPVGSVEVISTLETVLRYQRRADVRAWVLEVAGDTCEGCRQKAPFYNDDNEPYLEVHHVRPLRDGGPDRTDNAIAACPTCHRRLHFGKDRETFRLEILGRVRRLVDYPARTRLD